MFIIGYNLKKKLSEKAKVQYTPFLFLKEQSGTDPFFSENSHDTPFKHITECMFC